MRSRLAHRLVRAVGCVLAFLSASTSARAQSPHVYAGGAFTLAPWHPESVSGGSPSTTYVNDSPDTLARGVTVEGGWFFRQASAIGVEVTVPLHRNRLIREMHYFTPNLTFGRYREAVALAVVRHQVRLTERIEAALMTGAGFVHGESRERLATGRFGSSSYELFQEERRVSDTSFGLTVGTDLALNLAPHFAVVPQFRLLIVNRGGPHSDPQPHFASFGLPMAVYRFGVGVRGTF